MNIWIYYYFGTCQCCPLGFKVWFS